tara:strand:+ start:3776 stop:4135 length:360 start_codon:yes stop_codon:yes gene_type:complete
MYRIPVEFKLPDLSGEEITQLKVGQFDIQFSIGLASFSISSPIKLFRSGMLIGKWEEDSWPDHGFKSILNVAVTGYEVRNDQLLVIGFSGGIEMHITDNSDQYESFQINIVGQSESWIV